MEKLKKIKFILAIVYLSIVIIFLWFILSNISLEDLTSYEFIKKNIDLIINFKESNIFISSIIFLIFVVLWVLLLGFGSPIALLGGFIFGQWYGLFFVTFSLSLGALILYLFSNFFLKEIIKEKFEIKYSNLKYKFKKNEFIYFLIYRFIGGIPFFIANILPTLFNIKIKNYFFGTLLGMAPQIFVIVSLGSGLENIINDNSVIPSFFDILFTPGIYLPILGFIVLIFISLIFKKKF